MNDRILLATDGRASAAGALRYAGALAERTGAEVEVLSVMRPAQYYTPTSPEGVGIVVPTQYPAVASGAMREQVRRQMEEAGEAAEAWPRSVRIGAIAPTIARFAAERGVRLILLGLHEPGTLSRWFSRETLLRTIHLSHVPVLAVPVSAAELPRKAVAAVDFSEFSQRAVEEAARTMLDKGEIHLLHVIGSPSDTLTWAESSEWVQKYRESAERRLQEIAASVASADRLRVHVHLGDGDPGEEVLRLAEEIQADLLVSGSHGAGFFGRLVLGSVSGALVHNARCAVLIAPPEQVPAELEGGDPDPVPDEAV